MKLNSFECQSPFLIVVVIVFCLSILFPQQANAQYFSRTYADFQGVYRTGLYALGSESIFGSVSSPGNAIDKNPQNAASLNIGVGLVGLATVTQFLEFTANGNHSSVRNIAAGIPVTVKFTLPQSILGLADKIEIGTFTGLNTIAKKISGILGTGSGNAAGYNASNLYPAYSGSALLNAVNSAGQLELTFSPAQIYQGVYFKLSGNGLSLALSANLFHAYIMESTAPNCDGQKVIDILSGIRGNALVNILSATGAVSSPWNAADNDPALNTFSSLSTGAQVLGNVFETVIFGGPSKAGDSIQIVVQRPGGELLNLDLLTGFTIQPYLGNIPAGLPIINKPNFLSVRLFPKSSDKYIITAPVSSSFDRIEISMGGIAGALTALRIYDVKRTIPQPTLSPTATNDTIIIFKGNSVTLKATPLNNSDDIKWYDNDNNLVYEGDEYLIPSVFEDDVYYAKTSRNGCAESAAHTVFIKTMTVTVLASTGIDFKGIKINEETVLLWETEETENISHFELQKSINNIDFKPIGTIYSEKEKKFRFADKEIIEGNSYYRLKVYKKDGEVIYSHIIVIYSDLKASTTIKVSPNPAKNVMQVNLSGLETGNYRLDIRQNTGSLVYSQSIQVVSKTQLVGIQRPYNTSPGIYRVILYKDKSRVVSTSVLLK